MKDKDIEDHHGYIDSEGMDCNWVKKVVVIGAGGFGRECADIIEAMELHSRNVKFLWLLDDNKKLWGTVTPEGFEILTSLDKFQNANKVYFVCGVGDPKKRKEITEKAIEKGFKPITIIHPSVIVHTGVKIGIGCVIQEGSRLAINCTIGDHVHLNFDCIIGHDAIIEDYVTMSPKAQTMGDSKIKEGTFVGGNAFISQGFIVGSNSVVGAFSFVNSDMPDKVMIMGIPAKIKRML